MKSHFMLLNLICILSFALSESKTYVKPSKKQLDYHELDAIIKMNLERSRHDLSKIEYNLDLMDTAQYIANFLAKKGLLELPYIRLCKKYVGYAFRYQGYLKSAKKFFGSKVCFNNITPYQDLTEYDTVYDCTPKYIDVFDFDEYGYATAFDKEGNAYLIRLFTIRRFDPSSTIGHTYNSPDKQTNQTSSPIDTTKSNYQVTPIKSNLRSILDKLRRKSKEKISV